MSVLAGAFGGIARELGVLGHNRDSLRLRILRGRNLEEAFGERLFWRRARRQHREIFRVVKIMVGIECEQANQDLALSHDRRDGRGHQVRPVWADDEVDLVDVEQLRVDAGHTVGFGLVIVIDELHRPAEQAALGIGFLFPDLGAEQRLLAGARERAGLCHAKADLDWCAAALCEKSGRHECRH